ncbi:MAG TPA: twin-arginine translocation signal domain-containing protein [Gaiellales bacterium]|nr:twin-arginine translocation signal domain-containing protein [Gaiellales bacterium]
MVSDFSRRTFLATTALAVGAAAVPDVRAGAQSPVRGEVQHDPDSEQGQGKRLRTVGIMSPGDMGSAVGQVLAKHA